MALALALAAALARSAGIWSRGGPGPYSYKSIRDRTVSIWGQSLYCHMSAGVVPQGIAQDYVTLFNGVPVLMIALLLARGGQLRWRMLLAGVLLYFLVTYLFTW